jgi:hypothetical protein
MIKIGGIGDDMFFNELKRFVTDTMIQNVNYLVQEEFGDFSKTEKKINKAFRHYKYYFPQKEIPTIYTCVSGFNQSIVIADKLIGISLDKYLGNNCHYYDMLGIPKYKQQKMYHNKITSDIIHGWASTEFTKSNNESNLLSVMIYEGKLLYFLDAMLPQTNDTIKIGYTKEQLLWCKKNEAEMWTNLVENKKLYASARMDIKRLIDNSPYTNGFPRESPGRTGVWIGWQIIRSYMEQNKNVSLPQLMESNDSQKILNSSNYFPTKIF